MVFTIGITGCLLEVLKDNLTYRYQTVRCGSEHSDQLLIIASDVPSVSVIEPLLLLSLIDNLPDCLFYSEPFVYADNLKSIVITAKKLFS